MVLTWEAKVTAAGAAAKTNWKKITPDWGDLKTFYKKVNRQKSPNHTELGTSHPVDSECKYLKWINLTWKTLTQIYVSANWVIVTHIKPLSEPMMAYFI